MSIILNQYRSKTIQEGGLKSELISAIDGFYCISRKTEVQLAMKTDKDKVIESAIDQVFGEGKVDAGTRKKLIETHYAPLKEGVDEGFRKEIVKVEYGTPNHDFLKQLQTNAACFSAFKSHAQIKEMTALVKDENGNIRNKADFKKKALALDANYRGAHLDVEYDTCVRNARSAAQWQKAQSTKRLYPNIKYVASKSAHPRSAHQAYYGLIRPIDDPIWSTILPINAWGCKCSWIITDEDVTDIPSNLPAPDPTFAFNPGKEEKVFDLDKSSYANDVPKTDKASLIKEATAIVNNDFASNAPYFEMYKSKATGSEVLAHPMAKDNGDFKEALETARSLANASVAPKKIEILPELKDKNSDLRKSILPNVKEGKNPDYRIDGEYADLKTVSASGKKSITDALDRVRDQADTAVIYVTDDSSLSMEDIINQIKKKYKFKEMNSFKDTYLFYRGTWYKNPQKQNKLD